MGLKDKMNEDTCGECGKRFDWKNHGDVWPGGKDKEYIRCPYCYAKNGSIITSGKVSSFKID